MVSDFIKRFLRKYLGVDELKEDISNLKNENNFLVKRIENSSQDRVTLEERLIQSERKERDLKKLISENANKDELNKESKQFLEEIEINLKNKSQTSIINALKASEIIQKYGFEKFVPPVERGYNKTVITIEEFRENPTHYLHKLSKGSFNFPVSINFDQVNKILKEHLGNYKLESFSNGSEVGLLEFAPSTFWGHSKEGEEISKQLISATNITELNKNKCDSWVSLDGLDFIHNYEGFEKYVSELPELNEKEKEKLIKVLRFTKFSYLTALEIPLTTKIKDLSELVDYNEKEEEEYLVNGPIELTNGYKKLKNAVKKSLLSEQKGMTYLELEKILSIRSKPRFIKLASEITNKILSNDKKHKGLTNNIDKSLNEYSIGEAILLASYFARNVIEGYKKTDELAKELYCGFTEDKIVGKCTDYTGLAIHYLREYLAPMQPEKFKNWQFGFDSDEIGDYCHCYMKILHINKDLTVNVYYADPTKLCSSSIDELKTPEDVLKITDAMKLPLEIKRDAEDILYSANEKMKED